MPDFNFRLQPLEETPEWSRVQPNSRGMHSAYVRRQLIRLFEGDYDLLESEAREIRFPYSPRTIGLEEDEIWTQTFSYYEWNDRPQWDRFFTAIDEWEASFPDSPYPHLARATGLISYGWAARGVGSYHTVSPEDLTTFKESLQSADRNLDEAVRKGGADHLMTGVLRVRIARGLGKPKEETASLVKAFIEKHPSSSLLYVEWINYLLPRWHGQRGEWQAWLQSEAEADKWGNAGMPEDLYARILWRVYNRIGNSDGLFFGHQSLDWNKASRGLELCANWDIAECPYWKTVRVALAHGTNDRRIVVEAIQRLDGEFDSWVINSNAWARLIREIHPQSR
ncbi:MAG: hypothetical protein LAT58_07625 [Opitutales bacterium]|nr:hypothetical protein [Opitutales bacterium]